MGIVSSGIEGEFTPEGKLYQVTFLGLECDDYPLQEYPFRDFLTAKFGLESRSAVNRWIVGDREISIRRKRSFPSLQYVLRLNYSGALLNRGVTDDKSHKTEFYDFYAIFFVSDSLRMENDRQISELHKIEQDVKNEEMWQKQEELANDLKSL